jgi:hypothetical protein
LKLKMGVSDGAGANGFGQKDKQGAICDSAPLEEREIC